MNSQRTWSPLQIPIFEEFKNGLRNFAVEARAGTGKTTVIQHGISLAPEQKKVYLAFNKKNVLEAKEKISDENCQIMSLNGLGYRFVRSNWKMAKPDDAVEGERIYASVAATKETQKFAKNDTPIACIKQIVSFAKNTKPFGKLEDIVDMATARNFRPEQRFEEKGWDVALCCQVAIKAMEAARNRDRLNRISFDDQIWLPLVMSWARPWFDLVVVDECQDMNYSQLLLAQRSCKPKGRIVVVGDIRQCIYSFRGADVGGMERLKRELNAATFPLTVTYRCPQTVVDLAKILVPDYVAHETAPAGSVREIAEERLAFDAIPGDAVLSRTNAPLMKGCLAMIRRNVPAYIEGRDVGATLLSIHDKMGGRDCQSYLEALDSWGAEKIGRLVGDPDSDQFKNSLQTVEDQVATLSALAEDAKQVSDIRNRLTTIFQDSDKAAYKAVVFSTVHKAKGLEWGRVFLLRDTFKSCSWDAKVTENNNIAYVAITRAKNSLVWVNSPIRKTAK